MDILNRLLDPHSFQDYLSAYDFGPQPPNKLVIHHTWRPTVEGWGGQRSIMGLKRYYEEKGWPAGPHLFVGPDGIWLFSPMRHDGVHAGSLNTRSVGIEVVGDYDNGQWQGFVKYNALAAISLLMRRLGISAEALFFHRDVSSKSCPGWGITKEWLLAELAGFQLKPRLPGTAPVPSWPMDTLPGNATPTPLPVLHTPVSPSTPPPLPEAFAGANVPLDEDVMIPVWAAESVAFIREHHLFEIHSYEDVRDAVKFHRLYKLIQSQNG